MTREFEIDGTKVIILNTEKEEAAMRRLAEMEYQFYMDKKRSELYDEA